jgi:DNA polymerase elongation subunit (family B)
METLAAGYADPEWVPDKITCISASWIGDDHVSTWVTGQLGYWSRKQRADTVLRPFRDMLAQADVLTGHNIERFDLRVFNAECMRCGIEPVRRIRTEDTMRILRAKGYKKGLDNIATELGVGLEKKAMNWAQWDLAYEDPSWREVVERCETDVRLHKLVREEMKRRRWLRPERTWGS